MSQRETLTDWGKQLKLKVGSPLLFRRSINASGNTTYFFQNNRVSFETYNKRLLAIGLNIKARNFLVFQGDVESIAERTPRELTSLFEQVSNSEDFREEYTRKQRLKDASEETSLLAWQKRKAVNAEQRVARAMKLEAEKFKASQKKLQTVKREYFLWQLFHVESDRQKREKEVEEMRKTVESLENDLHDVSNEVKSARKKRAEAQRTEQDAQKRLDKLRRKLRKDDEPVIIKHRQKIAHTEDMLKKNQDAANKMDRDALTVSDSLKELQKELQITKRDTVKFEKRREEILKSQPLLSLQDKDLEELELKQAEVRVATVKLDQSLSKLNQEQQVDRDRLATLEGMFYVREARERRSLSLYTHTHTHKYSNNNNNNNRYGQRADSSTSYVERTNEGTLRTFRENE